MIPGEYGNPCSNGTRRNLLAQAQQALSPGYRFRPTRMVQVQEVADSHTHGSVHLVGASRCGLNPADFAAFVAATRLAVTNRAVRMIENSWRASPSLV